jgi:hypothetical protein
VLLADLGVCADVEEVREVPILEAGWRGMLGYEFNPKLWWWFLEAFCGPEERARAHRAASAVRGLFLDLARLRYAETGEATPLPERLIRALEMRVIGALHPSAYQVATGATQHRAARASANLARLTEATQWQARS